MPFRPITPEDLPRLARAYSAAFALPPYEEQWGRQDAEDHLRAFWEEHPQTCWSIYTRHPLLPVGGALGRQETPSRLILAECFIEPTEHAALGTSFVDELFREQRAAGARSFELILERHGPPWAFLRGIGFRTSTHLRMLWRTQA